MSKKKNRKKYIIWSCQKNTILCVCEWRKACHLFIPVMIHDTHMRDLLMKDCEKAG